MIDGSIIWIRANERTYVNLPTGKRINIRNVGNRKNTNKINFFFWGPLRLALFMEVGSCLFT